MPTSRVILSFVLSLLAASLVDLPIYAADAAWEAHLMINRGHYDEAEKFLEPLVAGSERDNAWAQYLYASLLRRKGKKEEAKPYLERSLKLQPYSWQAEEIKRILADMEKVEDKPSIKPSLTKGGLIGYVGLALDGRLVTDVFPDSPADRAKVRAGDRIESVDGKPASEKSEELVKSIRGLEGTTVNLVVMRNGKRYRCILKRGSPVPSQRESMSGTVRNSRSSKTNERTSGQAQNKSSNDSLKLNTGTQGDLDKPSKGATSSASGASPGGASNKQILDEVDKEMVSVFRRTNDTEAVFNEVIAALHAVPTSVKKSLADWGLKVVITPTVLTAFPDFVSEKPRGYSHGGNYNNSAGLFYDKKIYVAERVQAGNHPPQLNAQVTSVFMHEFGHAFDRFSQRSGSDEFHKVYTKDTSPLKNEPREKFYYFLQEGAAGRSEMFAELTVAALAPQSLRSADSDELKRLFPNCFKFVSESFHLYKSSPGKESSE